jgi:hypothetical protein
MKKEILVMKNLLLLMLLMALLSACSAPQKNSNTVPLEKIFKHLYSLENEGLRSLSLEVDGSHELVKNFLMDLHLDSGKIIVYWQAPFEMKTLVFSKTGVPVSLPRWLDFGFAFGIFYGNDLAPIFNRPEAEIKLLENEFDLGGKGTLKISTGKNNQQEILLKNPNQKATFLTIVTDSTDFPLNRFGSKLFKGGGQMIEIGYSENWIKLPNNKAITSFRQQSTQDKSQKKLEHRIEYKKIADYWFPSEIIERKRATQAGKIQKQDTRLVYQNYQINAEFPAELFQFEQATHVKLNLSTPDSTLKSLVAAARAGNIAQMQDCFSKAMAAHFQVLTSEASQGITPFAIIPDEMLIKIQKDVTRWVFGSYVESIAALKSTVIEQTTDKAILTVDYAGHSSLFRGQYHLVKEGDSWKIDTNPYVIFKTPE